MSSFEEGGECRLDRDPQLLAEFREGRRDALERIYHAHVQTVERTLRRLVASAGQPALEQPCVIADLLQDVFVRAFSTAARRGYDGQREFGPYLAQIAHNCFVDLLRTSARVTLKQPLEIAVLVDATVPEPDDWCDPRATTVLGDYLRALPIVLKDVYQQRYVLGRSQYETCAALGLSRRAVRTGEDRLRAGLRRALARAGIARHEQRRATAGSPTARRDLGQMPSSNVSRNEANTSDPET